MTNSHIRANSRLNDLQIKNNPVPKSGTATIFVKKIEPEVKIVAKPEGYTCLKSKDLLKIYARRQKKASPTSLTTSLDYA
jgi:hypothetical protein